MALGLGEQLRDSYMTAQRRRPRRWSTAAVVWTAIAAVLALAKGVSGADTFPESVGYVCESHICVYEGDTTAVKYTTVEACVTACASSIDQPVGSNEGSGLTENPTMTLGSSLNGTCANCSLVLDTYWNFPLMLETFDLTTESLASCSYTAKIEVTPPSLWVLEDTSSDCAIGSTDVSCSREGNTTTLTLNDAVFAELATYKNSYKIEINQVTTRSAPGTYTEANTMVMTFDGTGCRASANSSSTRQVFSLSLTASGYELVGTFSEMAMTASDPRVLASTSVSVSFLSGAMLSADAFFLLRVASDMESYFSTLIPNISAAQMEYGGESYDLEVYVGEANVSFTIPEMFNDTINNGESVNITFDNFQNPSNDSSTIKRAYLSAYQGLALAVDNSPVSFFDLQETTRSLKAAGLDIATIVVFGTCFIVSLVIIKWHGLPLTMTTLWTDMVAISALFSFASGCGGSIVWVVQPSKAYVNWYAAQFFFMTVMILSLCFHWATVLSFKCFKKMSFKSPVVIAYVLANGAVLAFIILCLISTESKLHCVFDVQALKCSSEEECDKAIAAGGTIVRNAVRTCDMQSFYLAFGAGFIVYTVLLMVLGCMVMCRGRSLMLNEDPSEPRIRQSLTIFYAIIATTVVLDISAQVIYIAQYISKSGDSGELSDLVWYIFIIWFPQGLPPLLLLFLQWNPRTENIHVDEGESMHSSKELEDVFNLTPRSSGSSSHLPYAKLHRDRVSMGESMLNNDDPGTRLRLIVRLKMPASFDRACFVSLDFFSSRDAITSNNSLRSICRVASWKCVGTTEPVGVAGDSESVLSSSRVHAIFPFVAVLEVPVIGPTSNTLLRFVVHASTLGKRDTSQATMNSNYLDRSSSSLTNGSNSGGPKSDSNGPVQLSYQMTMFQPFLEFVTSSQAVLDAAASGQPLNVHPTDEHTCAILEEMPNEIDTLLQGNLKNAELSVQTVMMPGDVPMKEDLSSHKNIGNLIRFFQYDSEDGGGGLVVEDLQESVYSNAIPRQLIELIAAERQQQVEKAREDLQAFLNHKKEKSNHGFYGNLIGQIQDEGDSAIARSWLEARLKKRKEYVSMIRKNIQYLVNLDKHKQYFKASVEKKSEDLRFVPINLHIQDLLIGPTNAFINDEKRRSSKDVSTYDFTTVGAPSAHVYKFNKGGILSYQTKLKKMQAKMSDADLDLTKWPEEAREYDDMKWDLQLRMDVSFAQALAALTCSFVRKIEIAIQNPDPMKGEDILCQLSSLGFLFEVESLLSTHGKEIGMIEDMAGAVARLSCVAFVIQDIRDRPANRFSFRMSRKKDVAEDAAVVKVNVSQKHNVKETNTMNPNLRSNTIKYIITVQIATTAVELPDRLANGGEIIVTPLLFTHGINEMQTIANNTERAKTELQDMININNLRPLKAYCEKYCRYISSSSPPPVTNNFNRGAAGNMSQRFRSGRNGSRAGQLTEEQVTQEFRALESSILEAAQSLVKTKRPEILQRSSDLCREMGGGRVTVCKSAKDRTAMSVTLEQVRILQRHHDLPLHRIPATVSVMRSHGVRIENALKNTGKRQFAFNKLQRSLLPEEYRCPDQVGGTGNVS